MGLIPRKRWFDFTYVLIEHGRAICTARSREVPGLPGQRPVPVEPRLSRRVRGSAGDREPVAGTLLRCRFAGSPEPLLTLAGGALLPSTRPADDPPLLLGRPSPHAGVLRRVERPREALRSDLAAEAHGLRDLDLIEREPRRPDRKEKLRILVEAPRAIQPLHRSAFDLESKFSPEGGRELPPRRQDYTVLVFPDAMAERRFSDAAFPILVAHRGDPLRHPENSVEGFISALRTGVDAVEFDVRLTRDAVPVIMHDADVSRTTDGRGLVHELTLEEIRRLSLRGNEPGPDLGRGARGRGLPRRRRRHRDQEPPRRTRLRSRGGANARGHAVRPGRCALRRVGRDLLLQSGDDPAIRRAGAGRRDRAAHHRRGGPVRRPRRRDRGGPRVHPAERRVARRCRAGIDPRGSRGGRSCRGVDRRRRGDGSAPARLGRRRHRHERPRPCGGHAAAPGGRRWDDEAPPSQASASGASRRVRGVPDRRRARRASQGRVDRSRPVDANGRAAASRMRCRSSRRTFVGLEAG